MKLYFLETAELGLRWFKRYYFENPQLNKAAALKAFERASELLKANPYLGHRFQDMETVREYTIPNTSFSLLYTIHNDAIWVIDLRDQRGLRSSEALRNFTSELRKKHQL